MTAAAPTTATPDAPHDTARPRRAPWWVLAVGVAVFAVTGFYLTNSVLPPMLDTDVTIPADGEGGPSGSDHAPPPPGGFDHGPDGEP